MSLEALGEECAGRGLLGLAVAMLRRVQSPPPGELFLKLEFVHEEHFLPTDLLCQANHLVVWDTLT